MPGQHGQGTDAAVTAGRPGADRFSDHGSIAGAPGALKGARTRRNQRVFVWEYRRREPSRLPKCLSLYINPPSWGHVAEWLRNGLQNRVHQFNSGRGLHPTVSIG